MKKVLIVVLLALVIGGGLAHYIFNRRYVVDDDVYVKVSAFQVGVFTNYDNALKVADRNNGIVVAEDDIYRVYVSILSDKGAVDKMKKYYDGIGLNYYLKSISVSKKFVDSIKDNEELLVRSSSDTFSVINKSILNRFEEVL